MTTNNLTTPAGTYGLAVEPWCPGDIYAVAANWAQASAPVYSYGAGGWDLDRCGRQVADFRHRPEAALRDVVEHVIAVNAGVPADEVDADEVDDIVADAVRIDDSSDEE